MAKTTGHWIEAVHIPASLDAPVRTVVIDRRNVVLWYPLVSGGPVEAAVLSPPDLPEHEVYVNSKFLGLPVAEHNPRADFMFEVFHVPVAGSIRGDVLVVGAPGVNGYCRSVARELVSALCD